MRRMEGSSPPSRTLDTLGLVAVLALVLGPLLAWLRWVPGIVGFGLFALGGILALVVTILGVIRAIRGRGYGPSILAATLGALAFVVLAARSGGAPRINDFTTDLDNPPVFKQAASDPANVGRDLSYPAAFAAQQRACCSDLAPMHLPNPPAAAFAMVELVAAGMPNWKVTRQESAAGELEATTTSRLFGFHDDVIVRVRPDAGGGSLVDMRSKSRVGQGDLGANAARIRAFQAALQARQQPKR
jgi:uncharacterized protein (DUF1499 family)